MRKDSRLSRVLHALIHLDAFDEPVTSEQLSQMMQTNPVVVRRMMGALRNHKFVNSSKGQNGGWTLVKPLQDITLLDVHLALGEKSVFSIGLSDEHTSCPIEMSVNQAITEAMSEAETLLLKRFGEVSLDQLAFTDSLKDQIKQKVTIKRD